MTTSHPLLWVRPRDNLLMAYSWDARIPWKSSWRSLDPDRSHPGEWVGVRVHLHTLAKFILESVIDLRKQLESRGSGLIVAHDKPEDVFLNIVSKVDDKREVVPRVVCQ